MVAGRKGPGQIRSPSKGAQMRRSPGVAVGTRERSTKASSRLIG